METRRTTFKFTLIGEIESQLKLAKQLNGNQESKLGSDCTIYELDGIQFVGSFTSKAQTIYGFNEAMAAKNNAIVLIDPTDKELQKYEKLSANEKKHIKLLIYKTGSAESLDSLNRSLRELAEVKAEAEHVASGNKYKTGAVTGLFKNLNVGKGVSDLSEKIGEYLSPKDASRLSRVAKKTNEYANKGKGQDDEQSDKKNTMK